MIDRIKALPWELIIAVLASIAVYVTMRLLWADTEMEKAFSFILSLIVAVYAGGLAAEMEAKRNGE